MGGSQLFQENLTRNKRAGFMAALGRVLEGKRAWRGSPSDLADELHAAAPGEFLPEARGIGGWLDEFQGDIAAAGWRVTSGRTRDGRWIELQKIR